MGTANGSEFLRQLRDFLAFLRNLWGILGGVSAFFPLSNELLKVIPLKAYGEGGVYDQLSPALTTTVATVVTLFVFLWTFINRSVFKQKRKRRGLQRQAWLSFGLGMLALMVYLVVHSMYSEYAWSVWGWGSGDPRKLLAEVPLLIAYSAFFALVTRAFMLLGMIGFFGREK